MNLTHLTIGGIFDDSMIRRSGQYQWKAWDGDFFKEMLIVLQAQPSLESLSFCNCKFSDAFVSDVETRLSRSDVPALKSVTARPEVAAAFLRGLGGLEKMTLALDEWGNPDLIPRMSM
ncbi:hypothetical protein FRC00_008654, partial [Tulasnella sp. 408]